MNLSENLAFTMAELNEAYNEGTLYEYISDALEVEYTMNLIGDLRGVKILVTFGDPDIYINTRTGKIEAYSNGEYDEVQMTYEVIEEIENIISDIA